MKDKRKKGRGGFVLLTIIDAMIAMIWYKIFLFRSLPDMMLEESKKFLWGMIVISILLETFVFYRRERKIWNKSICLIIPFGIYTMITYWNTRPMLIKAALTVACVFGVIGSVLCLSRRIKERDKRKRRRMIRVRMYKCICFFRVSIAIAMAVVIGVLSCQIIFGDGVVNPVEVKASLGTDEKQTIKQNIDIIQYLQEDEWEKLETQERMEVLQCVANIEASYLGLPHELNVNATNMSFSTLAYYTDATHSIYINLEYLEKSSAADNLESICHEARHAFQHRLVEAYNSTDEECRTLRIFDKADKFASEFADYDEGTDDFDKYYEQECETDSRAYAKDAVCDYYEKIEYYLNNENAK